MSTVSASPHRSRLSRSLLGAFLALGAAALFTGLALITPARAETQSKPPGVSVRDARLRWLPGDLPLAGYMMLTNHTHTAQHLMGASSKAFARVMLHRSTRAGGVEHMQHVDGVDIAPGASMRFAPGGYHLMLMHRRRTIHVGQRISVTLHFADGRRATVPFKVEGAGTQ